MGARKLKKTQGIEYQYLPILCDPKTKLAGTTVFHSAYLRIMSLTCKQFHTDYTLLFSSNAAIPGS